MFTHTGPTITKNGSEKRKYTDRRTKLKSDKALLVVMVTRLAITNQNKPHSLGTTVLNHTLLIWEQS